MLKLMVCETELEIGDVVKHAKTTPVGTVADEVPPDVLPLPLPSAAENRIYTLIKNGMPAKEVSKSFVKTIHTAGIGAWVFLVIVILNFMYFGSSAVTPWSAPGAGCLTAAPWLVGRMRRWVSTLARGETVMQCSQGRFRWVWAQARKELRVPERYAPYGLRRGGATSCFRDTGAFDRVCDRGRWGSVSACRIYIATALQAAAIEDYAGHHPLWQRWASKLWFNVLVSRSKRSAGTSGSWADCDAG